MFIGALPRAEWLDAAILRDRHGIVRTGTDLTTCERPRAGRPTTSGPVPGEFAAGDVRGESVKRLTSAVGEGAMAVTLVHRYLCER